MATNFANGYASIVKTNKNDDGTLTVYGKATDSSIDIDQQICDENWLKDAMPQWMVSGGNIREQHSSIAAGVATEYEAKSDGHYITALVVDPVSVKKVETGVLKGFSIGIRGPRVVRDTKAAGGRIIDGQIVEISLVDRPANPNAKLMLAKTADSGELEAVKQITIPSPKVVADLVKGSEDQPRDEKGRFSSTGGESDGTATHDTSGSGVEGINGPALSEAIKGGVQDLADTYRSAAERIRSDAQSEPNEGYRTFMHDSANRLMDHADRIENNNARNLERMSSHEDAVRSGDDRASGKVQAEASAFRSLGLQEANRAGGRDNLSHSFETRLASTLMTSEERESVRSAAESLLDRMNSAGYTGNTGKSGDADLAKFDENQERDEHGRFSSGGGSDSDDIVIVVPADNQEAMALTQQVAQTSEEIVDHLNTLDNFYMKEQLSDDDRRIAERSAELLRGAENNLALAHTRANEGRMDAARTQADRAATNLDRAINLLEDADSQDLANIAESIEQSNLDLVGYLTEGFTKSTTIRAKTAKLAELLKFDENQERDERGRFGSGSGGSKDPVEQQRYRNVANGQVRNGNRAAERAAEDIRSRVDHHVEDIRLLRSKETDPDKLGHLDNAVDRLSSIHDTVNAAESARNAGDLTGARSAIADARSSAVAAQNEYRAATGQALGAFNFGSIKEFVNNYQSAVDLRRDGERWLSRNKSAEADSKVETMETPQDPIASAKSIMASLIKFDKKQFDTALAALSNLIVVEAKEQKEGHSEVESIEQLLESVKHLYLWYDGEVREGEVPSETIEETTEDYIALSATKADGSCEHDCQACADGEGCSNEMCKCSTGKSVSLDVDDAALAVIIDKAVASAKASVVDEIETLKSAIEAEREKAIQLEVELETAKKAVAPVGPKRTAGVTVDNTALLQKAAEYNQKAKATSDPLLAKGYRELATDLIESSKKED